MWSWAWMLGVMLSVSVVMGGMITIAPLLQIDIGEVVGIESIGVPEYFAYFLAGAVGVFILGIAFAKPFWGILIVMLLLPFRSEEYALANIGGAVIRVADPVALFTFIGLLNRSLFAEKKGLPLERSGVEFPLLVLVWWTFLSFTWCESFSSAISKLLQFSYAIVLFYMVLALIETKQQLITAAYSWLIGGLFIGWMSFMQGLAGIGGGGGRAESAQTSAIETGEYLNYSIIMGIGLYMIARSKLNKTFLLLSVMIMLFGTLFGSASRGPLLGLAAALVFLYFFCDKFRIYVNWSIPFAVVGTVAAFFIVGFFGENLIDLAALSVKRFIELLENPKMDVGWAYRINIWTGIWQMYLEHPILGIGVGSLSELLPKYTSEIFAAPQLAHNLYLEVFVALGPIGFLIFCWLIWRMIRIFAQYIFDRTDYALHLMFVVLLAAQVAKAVGNLTFGMFFEDRVEWVAVAMCFVAVRIFQNADETQLPQGLTEETTARA
jgi:O-antigen ligase